MVLCDSRVTLTGRAVWRETLCGFYTGCVSLFQIVSQRKLTKALLKQGNTAGKSSITVRQYFQSQSTSITHVQTHTHEQTLKSSMHLSLHSGSLKIINLTMLALQSCLFLISISFSLTSLFYFSSRLSLLHLPPLPHFKGDSRGVVG